MPLAPSEADRLIRESLLVFRQETVSLEKACGRILREPVRADRDIPPCNRVTMDGYALRSHDVGMGVQKFIVQEFQPAGAQPVVLSNVLGTCVEVATGAMLPTGADCVVPKEQVTRKDSQIQLLPSAAGIASGSFVHARASDAYAGTPLLEQGTRLRSRELAIAASVGACQLQVSVKPSIYIISTGDELEEPSASVQPWQFRRSNDVAIANALISAGFDTVTTLRAKDSEESLEKVLQPLMHAGNVIILTGGVSQGNLDLVPAVLERLGVNKVFHGIAQRPGRPMYFGVGPQSVPVFALPGNPASTFITLHRYVLPALLEASVAKPLRRPVVSLTEKVVFKPALACFMPVRLESGLHGELLAKPIPLNTSGDYMRLAKSDGFVELPAERDEHPAGYATSFWRWA